ncbi:MAG: SH3 domain-containing protein [Clostridiales bacterium]|nr:SH3 domain-containing protein [Clostridiales bacterium]
MRKYGVFYLGLLVLVLGGCSNRNKMPEFIPTPTVSPTPIVDIEEEPEEVTEHEDIPIEELDLSKVETTPKYIRMSKFGSTLNVRSKPSTDSDIIGYLVHREKIDVIAIKDGWAAFIDDDIVKYVSADYLVDERPEYLEAPTVTPTPTPAPTPTAEPTKKPEATPEAEPTETPDSTEEEAADE